MNDSYQKSSSLVSPLAGKTGDGNKSALRAFRFPWAKLLIVVLLALIAGGIYLTAVLNKVKVPPRPAYDKEGFVPAAEFRAQNGALTVLENENYRFAFSNTDTTFVLTDKDSGYEWSSNPLGAAKRFMNPLVLYYAGALGAAQKMGVGEEAVAHDDFYIRKTADAIEVLYAAGGKRTVDASDFPKVMTEERMQEKILSKLEPGTTPYRRVTEQCYVHGTLKGDKIWQLKDGIQPHILEALYEIFYDRCGYTTEDLAYDLELAGIQYEDKYPYFEIAVRYELSAEGLAVRLVNESIYEKEKFPLVYVDLLPYFGSATTEDVGYTLIPDGSGALIEHNNGRSFAMPYLQRIYGADAAEIKPVMLPAAEKISFPVFGIRRGDSALLASVDEGAAMAALAANGSTADNPYNQAYFRYYLRESQSFEFASYQKVVTVIEWTAWYNKADFVVKYMTVNEDGGSYAAMARKYREYLISRAVLHERTAGLGFNLTLLGGYIARDNFLGIPYETVRALTDTKEVLEIARELREAGIENLNIIYRGWGNDGIKPTYAGKIRYNRAVGKRGAFRSLKKELDALGVEFFPEICLQTAYTGRDIRESKTAARNVLGRVVKNYDYTEATFYADTSTRPYYMLKPATYEQTLRAVMKEFEKTGIDNLAVRDAGALAGSYHKKDTYFRADSERYFREAMTASFAGKRMFSDPNLYALPFCDIIVDLPATATPYQIIGVAVPFAQLVLSGAVSYGGRSINIDDKYPYRWHEMKAIETAADISFTWSYESTVALAETEYKYYSTYYRNWIDKAVETYRELKALGIHDARLVDHRLLTDDGSVVKSVYSDGAEIIFNYGMTPFNYGMDQVAPNSYYVAKGARS